QLPQEGIASLSVLDVSGRTVYQTSVTQTNRTIELNVPTGIYLVRVEAASGTETFKVALQ
ncbi:MAG: T9SS type A sorting domain-containing protein, partial [Flavobacteriales bacterium]|nr:T9SS type A sorting domain-containing protein [Flavobacteriales bacterium]